MCCFGDLVHFFFSFFFFSFFAILFCFDIIAVHSGR